MSTTEAALDRAEQFYRVATPRQLLCAGALALGLSAIAGGCVRAVPLLPTVLQALGLSTICAWAAKRHRRAPEDADKAAETEPQNLNAGPEEASGP